MDIKPRTQLEHEIIAEFRTLTQGEKMLVIEFIDAILNDQEKAEAMEKELQRRIAAAECREGGAAL